MKFSTCFLFVITAAVAGAGAADLADKGLEPDWVESLTQRGHALDAKIRGSKKNDSLKYIGMPVGGIGCGTVYLGGDGRLYVWDIFNQFHEGVVVNKADGLKERDGANYVDPPTPERYPGGFEQGFGLRIGDRFRRMEAKDWAEVEFRGDWPIGRVTYRDPAMPVEVSLSAFSPFIPLNLNDSALPVTVMEYTLRNTSAEPVTAALSGWLENAVGIETIKLRDIERMSGRSKRGALKVLQHSASQPDAAEAGEVRPEIVFADFEDVTSYGDWTVEGEAFGAVPVHKHNVPAYQGDLKIVDERAANSHASAPGKTTGDKDRATGKLTSAPFTIERDRIQFLIGGGSHKGRTCINLVVDGEVVRSATGNGSNTMEPAVFDVTKWMGREARLEIVDAASGSWGNIGVDHIVFTDEALVKEINFAEAGDFGTMALSVLDPSAKAVERDGIPGWESTVTIPPGESKTIVFMMSWYFPNIYKLWGFESEKNYYSARFEDATAVAAYAAEQYPRLREETARWADTWYDSTLPEWFMDRTVLTANTLQTANCWIFKDGQFWAWEGVGACAGTCTHVWQYAQALARLFPSLERNLREVTDFGYAQDPESGMVEFRGVNGAYAVDGQAGIVLRTYREHQMSPDNAFLKRVWPKCKLALQGLMDHDTDKDGLLDGPQHNTLDSAWYGEVAWLSGHYLAAVRAGEQMAREMGDLEFAAACRALAERGSEQLVDRLYDPERSYFINIIDPEHPASVNSGTGCHIDQVFGESWLFQIGLERVLPPEETRAALRALWQHNFFPDVGPWREANKPGRWYAKPGEAGLVMCTFPTPDWDYTRSLGVDAKYAWSAMYFNECMSGFEYQVASHMVYEDEPDLIQKGLAITRAIHDRYSPDRRNPYNEVECSDHYGRAAASYGVFLAACGFEYHGPEKRIGFAPRISPEDFRAPFTVAEGWGTYSQKQSGKNLQAELRLQYGKTSLRTLVLRMPSTAAPKSGKALVDGQTVPCTLVHKEGRTEVVFSRDVELTEGQVLSVSL
jgi:uncharacterized protein (DUF608 family)